MTIIPPRSGRRRPTEQETISLELVSGLLMIIGLLAFAYLFYAIATSPEIKDATQGLEIEGIGIEVRKVEPEGEVAYFEIIPAPGGPAEEKGVRAGDRLTKVEDTEITPGFSVAQVDRLLQEPDVKRADDDFEISIEFLRPLENGEFSPQERTIIKNVAPTFIIAYLNTFGIIVPFLTIVIGILIFRLGVRLRKFDLISARWAMIAFLWLIVGLIVAAIRAFWVDGKGGLVGDHPFNFSEAVGGAIPYLIAAIPLGVALWWLSRIINDLFEGEESLTSRNTRFAWSLLIPTLAVLILVAAQPLEQTFIASLTDEEFGSPKPSRFVGLRNYQELLSFKFVMVDCKKDDSGNCERVRGEGGIVWELSASEIEEREKLREMSSAERRTYKRYQEAYTWQLFGGDSGLRLLGKDPQFLKSFSNTLQFTFISVTLELLLGLIIAMVVNSKFTGRGLMRTAMLVPWAIPTVVSAALWEVIMRGDQTGILNKLLLDIGLISQAKQWLATTGPWMNSIIAVDVWKTAPFMALLLLAGLQTIPADVYEAADVDGAGKVRQFFTITLPLLRPTIAVALVFRTLDALRAFDVFSVLLDATRPSMALYNYDRLIQGGLTGYSSAIGVIIFMLILIFTVTYVRIVRLEQE
ncbi:MAG: ABC transporter permease subunit [Anaerolineae bacterium]|nr:ABC transporter permease subunit [Anaerolineae bacterium]